MPHLWCRCCSWVGRHRIIKCNAIGTSTPSPTIPTNGTAKLKGLVGDSRTLSLYLKPVSKVMYCEQCGARCQQIHETTVRRVRDLPLFEYRVVLHVPRRRVWCERCGGPTLEKLDWPGRYQRVTERFAKACEKLLQAASVQAVAAFYDPGWHTLTGTATRRTSSSRSAPRSPVICDEPKKSPAKPGQSD